MVEEKTKGIFFDEIDLSHFREIVWESHVKSCTVMFTSDIASEQPELPCHSNCMLRIRERRGENHWDNIRCLEVNETTSDMEQSLVRSCKYNSNGREQRN